MLQIAALDMSVMREGVVEECVAVVDIDAVPEAEG